MIWNQLTLTRGIPLRIYQANVSSAWLSRSLNNGYQTLITFLKSPESRELRDESERLLAEGKQVTLRIHSETGKPRYELEVD